jgi:signal peptidase I
MNIPFFGKKEEKKPVVKKSWLREWLDAAVFAIVAATIIRTFFIEAYTIPTPSMEKSLLVNDYLFVSKMHYGPRIPMTPLAVPFVHHSLPISGGKSYSEAFKWDYKRLWGFGNIERNDDVVFNWPADKENNRPVDKKENYIKRCVAIAGDTLEIRDRVLYINGKLGYNPTHKQFNYIAFSGNGESINPDVLDDLDISNITDGNNNPINNLYSLTDNDVKNLKAIPNVTVQLFDSMYSMSNKNFTETECFPGDTTHFKWNRNNYGPIYIPKKGVAIPLSINNIMLYKTLITEYEHHTLAGDTNNNILIDGKIATSYTPSMDYYWLMGDNRHNSLDSRYWGYVPEDHVVGKAWFIWMSYDKHGIRWKRLFRSVKALED